MNIAFITYDTKRPPEKMIIAMTGQPNQVKETWNKIIKEAENYQYAEQPGWKTSPLGKDLTKWPNSYYEISPAILLNKTNNSNTFIRFLLAQANLPGALPTGIYPGRQAPMAIIKTPTGLHLSKNNPPFSLKHYSIFLPWTWPTHNEP